MDKLKRKNILIVIFIITTIIASVLAVYFAISNIYSNENNDNIDTESSNTANNSDEITNDNSENNNDNSDKNEQNNSTSTLDPYANYKDFKWLTGNVVETPKIGYTIEIIENKLYLVKGNEKEVIPINGTAKCIKGFLNGGTLGNVYLLTNEGNAYIWNFEYNVDKAFSYTTLHDIANNIKFEGVLQDEKILEIYAAGIEPYFLTEKGKLINIAKLSYEDVVKNHTITCGNLGDYVYINSDATLSFHRGNYDCNDVLIVDYKAKTDKKLKIKYITYLSSNNTKVTYYAIGEDNKLYTFSKADLMIAYNEYENKDVSKLQIIKSGNSKYVQVVFTDGSTFDIRNGYLDNPTYYDFNKKTWINE